MDKTERITIIKGIPDGSLFLVRAPNQMFWKKDDRGYTEDITEARQWTKEEIIQRLQANGLMDKTIEIFTPQQSI